MGEALLGSAMEVVLERLQGQDLNELLKKLKIALLSVNSVVGDAEKKQYHNPAVKMWLDDFKDAFYHVEDLMDDILTEDLQQSLDHWQRIRKTDIERKTGEILMKIEYVAKQKDVLGLRETIVGYDMKSSLSMPVTSFVDRDGVFGRAPDVREIVKNLLSYENDKQLCVIAIVGMGGIGKTTLAQFVYNDHNVSEHFELKAWACISDNFNMLKVTKTILESITSEHSDFDELHLLQSKLVKKLRGKKFLLVLDDVWNDQYNDWEVFLSLLEVVVARGSRIIVTTRIQRVAEMMNAVSVHHLKELSISESWSLFQRISFGDEKPISHPGLKAIGNEIVKKCQGLPLAIKSVAASLRFKLQVREWNRVLEGLTNFPTGMRDVFNVLRQSYDHLPAHLKRCFEYCSIFPKGYEFEKEKLILLWMAEGLLQQPRGNHRMEDLGEEYFHELLSMSLFQASSGNKSRFRMHDLISDLAIYVSGRFSFRLENDDPTGLTASIRYLSLFRCKYDSPEIFEGIRKARYIRTFLPLNHELCHLSSNELQKLLFKLQFLRVLSLYCYHIDELPDSIGNLKHLRYIDLSYAAIKRLPKSVCALCNLQSLILFYCCSLTELPENMWQLVNLRHLDITGTSLEKIPREMCKLTNLQKLILANCHSLTELPENMRQLSNLSHLDITGTALKEIPREICELKNLQKLILANCHSLIEFPEGMWQLSNLSHLDITGTSVEKIPREMCKLTDLQKLILANCHSLTKLPEGMRQLYNLRHLDITGTALKEIPREICELKNLQKLILANCQSLTELPEGMRRLSNLSHLDITGTALKEIPREICELKNLQKLILANCHSLIELPEGRWQLSKLSHLDITGTALKEIPIEICGLKNLQKLILANCHSLTELPVGMSQLSNLSYLDITGTALKEIPREICELENLQKLILANCHSLTELPEGMWQLSNLSHLDITGTALHEMPKEMSRLQNLQTLPYFVAGKNTGSTVKELGGLLNLHGTLHISKLQNVVSTDDAIEASLASKTYLDELTLEWDDKTVDSENDRDVLEALEPHNNLKMLRIKFYGGTEFPFWLGDQSFSKMQLLCLSNCEKCLCLPPLGRLPSLKVLIIEGMTAVKRVGPEFCGMHMPFQSLETLTFEGMLEWEEWVSCEVDEIEFPRLQVLSIRRCPKLKGQLPKQLPSVVKVEISESQELMTALTMEASSQKMLLHYHDKVLSMSEEKVASFSEQNTDFTYEGAVESLLLTQGAPKRPLHIYDRVLSATEDEVASFLEDITVSTVDIPNDTWYSQDGLQDLSSSVSKKVSEISELKNLPENLHSLKIEGCDAEFISEAVGIYSLPLLQHIYIINCCSLKSFPGGCPPSAMRSLYIQNCKKLEFLPPAEMLHQYAGLQHLCIGSSCDSLISFPLGFFPKLRSLSIWDCGNLESLLMPEGIQKDLRALEALEIRACPKLVSFPGELPAPNLKSIWFSNCKNLKKLPDQLHNLNSLQSLFINDCPELVSLSEGGLPSELILLSITSCNKLMLRLEWGLDKLHHLCQLEIEGGCGNVVSFPEEKLLPRNLNSLRISELLNLEYLNYKGLLHLTALKTLEISCCNKLQSLPEEGLPSSLSFLCIKECSLLNAKLQNKAGKDWSKIAHISRIEID